MWFKLTGDARLGACASEKCWGQPNYRLEADGVGSNYCSGCKERIERGVKQKPVRRLTTHTEIIFGGIRLDPGTYEVRQVDGRPEDTSF